jgi:hypothetical protein
MNELAERWDAVTALATRKPVLMAARHPSPWPRDASGKPVRRVRVARAKNRNFYWRRDGRLEIGYRDSCGTQRWAGPFDTITLARAERDSILGAKMA